MTYSHMGKPTLPSALSRFTSEFGMESGGANSLLSPGNWLFAISKPKTVRDKSNAKGLFNDFIMTPKHFGVI